MYTADAIAVGAEVGRYRNDLAADLATAISLQNLAIGGSTSRDLLTTLLTDSAVRNAVAAADVVTFNIGGNDLLIAISAFRAGTCGGADGQDCFRTAIAGFQANWPQIVAELRALNHSAIVRTMTYYNPFVADLVPGDGTAVVIKPYAATLNETIRSTAPSSGVAIAEGAIAFNGPQGTQDPIAKGYIDTDHIHPSPLGYDVLAETFHELGYTPAADYPMKNALSLLPSRSRK